MKTINAIQIVVTACAPCSMELAQETARNFVLLHSFAIYYHCKDKPAGQENAPCSFWALECDGIQLLPMTSHTNTLRQEPWRTRICSPCMWCKDLPALVWKDQRASLLSELAIAWQAQGANHQAQYQELVLF